MEKVDTELLVIAVNYDLRKFMNACPVSPRQVRCWLEKNRGLTPRQLVMRVRLATAQTKLLDGWCVKVSVCG